MDNKTVLEKANAAISEGDHETFLTYCTENTKWVFVGDKTLFGKEQVRNYMTDAYKTPPRFDVGYMIGEDDYVMATGTISLKNGDGQWTTYDYCDIWRFENGLMAELRAFVIEK